jgi:uncharacterized protein YndB with AHSA1/START domain
LTQHASRATPSELGGTVIRRTVDVERSLEDAFRLFTAEIGSWWPLETHSVARENAATCVFEAHEGGRIFERTRDGQEILWGTVIVYEPPRRLVYRWHPGRSEETAQEVEMHFRGMGNRTRVEVEHRGWERYGEGAAEAMESYDTGWAFVLGDRYARAVTPT